jgi:hypothetical protein
MTSILTLAITRFPRTEPAKSLCLLLALFGGEKSARGCCLRHPGGRHIAVTAPRHSPIAPVKTGANRGHGVPVTPDERALSFVVVVVCQSVFLAIFQV